MGGTKKHLGGAVLDILTKSKGSEQSEPVKQSKQSLPCKQLLKPWAVRLPVELVKKIKDVSFWERVHVQSIVAEAMAKHITYLEKKRGEEYPERVAV